MSTSGPSKPSKLIFAPGAPSTSSTTADPTHASAPNRAAQFSVGTLHRSQLDVNPYTQFDDWFSDPRIADSVPETCTLSTAQLPSGRVSSRMVYLKELDARGWVVYSNWGTSRKARDWESNRYVALCFWWKGAERQVRLEGVGERLSREESQGYFGTRARGSRVGAWASRQSEVLRPGVGRGEVREGDAEEKGDDGRAELEGQVREVERRFERQEEIPVPEFWGGLRVVPDVVEFWQGRDSRLHDRFRYTRDGEGGEWKIERLSP